MEPRLSAISRLGAVLLLVFVLAGAAPGVAAEKAEKAENPLSLRLSEPAWVENLEGLLDASTVKGEGFTAYTELTDAYRSGADLYATAWFLKLVDRLDRMPGPERQKRIVEGLRSRRGPNGLYEAPGSPFPPLYTSYLALEALETLDASTQNPGLVSFIETKLASWGWLEGEGEADVTGKLGKTYTALKILSILNAEPDCLKKVRRRLLDLLEKDELFDPSDPKSLNQGGLVLQSLALLGVGPETLPGIDAKRHWAKRCWEAHVLGKRSVGAPLLSAAEGIIRIADYLEVALERRGPFFRALKAARLPNGGYGLSAETLTLDPQTTYKALLLYAYQGRPYPGKDALLGTVERYAVKGGWMRTVRKQPDLLATLYAVGISRCMNRALESKRIAAYLERVRKKIEETPEAGDLVPLYRIARVYQLLGVDPPDRERLYQKVSRVFSSADRVETPEALSVLSAAAGIARIYGWEIEKTEVEAAFGHLRHPEGGYGFSNAPDLRTTYHVLNVLRRFPSAGGELEKCAERILSRETDNGGFRRNDMPTADLDSLFYAVMGLNMAGRMPSRASKTLRFLESLRSGDLGFRMFPPDAPFKASAGASVDLRSIYEGFFVRGVLEEPSGIWTLPHLLTPSRYP